MSTTPFGMLDFITLALVTVLTFVLVGIVGFLSAPKTDSGESFQEIVATFCETSKGREECRVVFKTCEGVIASRAVRFSARSK